MKEEQQVYQFNEEVFFMFSSKSHQQVSDFAKQEYFLPHFNKFLLRLQLKHHTITPKQDEAQVIKKMFNITEQ